MMRRRIEAVRYGRTETGPRGLAGERPQHRPAIVSPSPEAVPVRDARVPELVGAPPVVLERDDIGPPRLQAARDHEPEDRRRFRGSQDWRAPLTTVECAAMRARHLAGLA